MRRRTRPCAALHDHRRLTGLTRRSNHPFPVPLQGLSHRASRLSSGVTNDSETHMLHARIAADPAVMMGKPSIKGTRITVELLLRKLGAGRSFADLLEAYPQLTEEDLRAALAFAADYLQHETVLAAE